eukprot:1114762_1
MVPYGREYLTQGALMLDALAPPYHLIHFLIRTNYTLNKTIHITKANIWSASTATIVGIVAGAIALAIIMGLIALGFSRKRGKAPQKETNQDPVIEIAPGTNKHSYEKISDPDEFEYKNVAPSAPDIALADDDAMNEVEGFLPTVEGDTDRYDHDDIRQWFNSSVNLQADNEKYLEIFINYGYDEMSLIQEIKESDLDTMGITKLAHKNRIMNAIKNIET